MLRNLFSNLFNIKDTQNFQRLMSYVVIYKWRIFFALLATVGVAFTESYLAAFIAPLINQGFSSTSNTPPILQGSGIFAYIKQLYATLTYWIWGTPAKVWLVPTFLIVLIIFRGICRYISNYELSWVGAVVLKEVRGLMFHKMLHLPAKYQSSHPSAFASNRFLLDAEAAIGNATSVFITLSRDSLTVLGLVCVLLYLNWQLCLIVLLIFPILGLLSRYFRKRLRVLNQDSQLKLKSLAHTIHETYDGHKVVKLYGGESHAEERFAAENNAILRFTKKLAQATSAKSPISELIASLALAVVIFIALWQSQHGITTVGEFMAFIVAMMQLISPLKNLSNLSTPMQRMFVAADMVFEFIDEPSESNTGTIKLKHSTGQLRFEHIDLSYDNQTRKALNDFNLEIKAGEKVALIGRSGSGKTSLINMLPRFIEPSSGVIYLDSHKLNDIDLASLRQQIALVSQDVFLFNDTLYNNIAYSKPNATPKDVEHALKAANLWDFVQDNPNGWDMEIGNNGNQLSGGQRQRLSIARAILKDAPLLILDEATSALDNESERAVQQALEHLMQGRTSIIIAHRLSTIQKADRIIVMNEGQIVEQGTHEQLLAQNGLYAHLSALPSMT
ncbi:lipid A export permease/ATP-binding protein MsbA [Hydromonas duriensis]|uniref:Lipid A export permease/ATP-binding protein MsbA n=1 Tax=Hydromonas duriensis TaxID=1527608 RepID=A0A4R6Y886_9BURK|nr:lipid A export permease/ATP-binding protein MsbA [Hydromonas duriensis]TDR31562.1 lipid A export permease/ATP-binding protein MsbA [Hydromonas duriensis]